MTEEEKNKINEEEAKKLRKEQAIKRLEEDLVRNQNMIDDSKEAVEELKAGKGRITKEYELKKKYGFKVLQPKFAFEDTEEWADFNAELNEIGYKNSISNLDSKIEKIENQVKKIEEQMPRMVKELELTKEGVLDSDFETPKTEGKQEQA